MRRSVYVHDGRIWPLALYPRADGASPLNSFSFLHGRQTYALQLPATHRVPAPSCSSRFLPRTPPERVLHQSILWSLWLLGLNRNRIHALVGHMARNLLGSTPHTSH